jgi:hypothetical protein
MPPIRWIIMLVYYWFFATRRTLFHALLVEVGPSIASAMIHQCRLLSRDATAVTFEPRVYWNGVHFLAAPARKNGYRIHGVDLDRPVSGEVLGLIAAYIAVHQAFDADRSNLSLQLMETRLTSALLANPEIGGLFLIVEDLGHYGVERQRELMATLDLGLSSVHDADDEADDDLPFNLEPCG